MSAGLPYPMSWEGWRRYYRAQARALGPTVWAEAAVRAGLARAAGAAWNAEADAPMPDAPPIVIIGHQRSGTTWLHRMLASHPEAAAMPLHTLLAPTDRWSRRAERLRGPTLDRVERQILGGMDPIHHTRLHEPEEDEFLLWVVFRSPMNDLDRPWVEGAAPDVDDSVAMPFYAQAVARHARRTGRRYVGKNPHFTWRTAALRAALPGVRLVQLWRHPAVAIPSRLSLLRAIWRRRGLVGDRLAPADVDRVVDYSVRAYLGGLDAADLDLRYDALVADPVHVVQQVHEALGLPPWTADDLAGLGEHQRAGRTPHRYSLAEFGLDATRLAERLAPVYDRFGFPVEPAGT